MVNKPKWTSAGGVVYKNINGKIHICLIKPSNGYGGYTWTFPKGRMDPGESKEETALREVREEAGVVAKIQSYLGQYEGTSSISHYFIMTSIEDGLETDFETEDVVFVPIEKASKMLNSSRDKQIIKDFINSKKK